MSYLDVTKVYATTKKPSSFHLVSRAVSLYWNAYFVKGFRIQIF